MLATQIQRFFRCDDQSDDRSSLRIGFTLRDVLDSVLGLAVDRPNLAPIRYGGFLRSTVLPLRFELYRR